MKASTIILAFIALSSCSGQTSNVIDPTIELIQGKLTYSISGEGTTSSWELEVLFNPTNTVIIEEYASGAGRKYLFNKQSNEIMGLISDAAWLGIKKDKYCIYYTPEDLVQSVPSFYGDTNVIRTQEFKEILGYKCRKWIIENGTQSTIELWTTDKIKCGLIYPWTPLTFESVALEYELKVLDKTQRKYVIKDISESPFDDNEFEHVIPDPYYLIVPAGQFSTDSTWTSKYSEKNFQSFSYPYLKDGRTSTIEFFKNELPKFIEISPRTNLSLTFFITEEGAVSNAEVSIDYKKDDPRSETIKTWLQTLNQWTPAKIKGTPVKSKVTIFG